MPSRHSTRRPSRFQIQFDFDAPQPGVSKRCTACGQVKLLDCFNHTKNTRDGRVQKCKPCRATLRLNPTFAHRRMIELAESGLKRCSKCGEIKPLDDFFAQKTARHGRKSHCKLCSHQAGDDWRRANREHANAWATAYYRRHAERKRARTKVLYDANPEVPRARSMRHYYSHHEECKARCRKWMRDNPLQARENTHRRRALLARLTVVPLTPAMIRLKFAYWGNRCWICGGPAQTIDHVKPISKGGPHVLANIRPACRFCNTSKHNKWPFKKGDINGS